MIEGGSLLADPQVVLILSDEHKAALITAIEEVAKPADGSSPGTNTTDGTAHSHGHRIEEVILPANRSEGTTCQTQAKQSWPLKIITSLMRHTTMNLS